MVLRQPVAVLPQPIRETGELERLADRVGGRHAASDGGLIEDAEAGHVQFAWSGREGGEHGRRTIATLSPQF